MGSVVHKSHEHNHSSAACHMRLACEESTIHNPQSTIPDGISTLDHLMEHLAEVLTPRTAVVCIGNELCGDDAAGPVIAKRLAGKVPWDVHDAQTVPESFLMKIVERRPDTVLLIDALDFGAAPGAIELFDASRLGGQGPSTHGPAPLAFLEVLKMFLPCRQVVLGIQPAAGGFGNEMCGPVRTAVDLVVEALTTLSPPWARPTDSPAPGAEER